ncbi:exonuclease subunit SbcD [Paraglaciecola psychrophila]|uniref:Nuclease SbcCD subunit D n=1 Tax=Paraglaciecola psychrophila 170 TaxID=1129794 RepID=K7ANP0_9ALTE|nr:exonuclease subunit SbcD [Paraglaciecola psychrophila]AGH43204.1 exonuclease SbcD [Paraglaciecola psychrophila 170]GAC36945.1 exonuclease SbcD [Paraglaciecola psychrophila 170]
MKLLHTSDWHLGQSFFTKSRKDEHQAFINWLLMQVEQQQVDAVIIAGDIFDTGTPPSYAREMYNQFVVDMQQLNCVLVVLGGNHDSVSTLNESKQILACLNTFVVASTGIAIDEQVFTIPDKSGQPGAILCAVPFIRARDVLQSTAGETGLQKRQALGDAIKQHYQTLYQIALLKQKEQKANGLNIPIIATGHLTALGVSQSESVRDIYIGTLDGFAADGFPPADYIALGHIHKPQIVAKSEHIRYCGSPIPLSFDELGTQKQVMLVEFSEALRTSLQPISIPIFQPMLVIKGDLAKIEKALQQLNADAKADIKVDISAQPFWLCLEVDTQDYLSDLQQRIQTMTQGLNVEVLQLRRTRNQRRQLLSQMQSETLAELTPEDVFEKRLAMETFDKSPEVDSEKTDEQHTTLQQVRQRFSQILSEVEHQGTDV